MNNLDFQYENEGHQTPMLKDGSRTPILNKIDMEENYQAWQSYKSNMHQQTFQQQNPKTNPFKEDRPIFKNQAPKQSESFPQRIIYFADRNLVDIKPIASRIDMPDQSIQLELGDNLNFFSENIQANQIEQNQKEISLSTHKAMEPDEEDIPFENYQNFIDDQDYQYENQQNSPVTTQNKQSEKIIPQQNLNNKNFQQNNYEKKQIINNPIQEKINDPQKEIIQDQNKKEEKIIVRIPRNKQDQNINQIQNQNTNIHHHKNYNQNNYQNQEYDPVQAILDEYQYKGDSKNHIHQQTNTQNLYTEEPQRYQNQQQIDSIQYDIPSEQMYQHQNQQFQNRERTTNISHQYKEYERQQVNKVYQQQQPQKVKFQDQVQPKQLSIIQENENENISKFKQKQLEESEKLRKLQEIKNKLEEKEREQQLLNQKISEIYSQLDKEKHTQQSILEHEQSLVKDLNLKNYQIQKLKEQNDELRKKINYHYNDTIENRTIDPMRNKRVLTETDLMTNSQKIQNLHQQPFHESIQIQQVNNFDTFGQKDSFQNIDSRFQTVKKREASPNTNLRRIQEIIPTQKINPSDYRPPTYDSVDQQQFSQIYNKYSQYNS